MRDFATHQTDQGNDIEKKANPRGKIKGKFEQIKILRHRFL